MYIVRLRECREDFIKNRTSVSKRYCLCTYNPTNGSGLSALLILNHQTLCELYMYDSD